MDEVNREMKIAALVILYNPDETLLSNLDTYCSYVDKIYVYDNTERAIKTIDFSAYPKVEYYHDGLNRGVADRLNMAAERAINEGYNWLLTMDQDSSFTKEAIKNYLRNFSAFCSKNNIALFGPVHFEENPGLQADCKWQEVDQLITSGALLNLSLFNEIGRFDEALFIDSVDFDYCIRAKLAGYRIVQFPTIVMLHKLGFIVRRASFKTLFFIKKRKELHSPLRCYYMFRNILYLKDKYRDYDIPVLKIIAGDVRNRIKRYLFYGRASGTLAKYILLAYKDYKNNRMGKFVSDRRIMTK